MWQASRRVSSWALFCSVAMTPKRQEGQPVQVHSLSQLHSYRGRQGEAMRFGRESWCLATRLAEADRRGARVGLQPEPTLAIATDAVSTPTKRTAASGGVAERFKAPVLFEAGTREGREGSIPSSTTEHQSGAPLLNNDRVVQRRRAGQRCHHRPAPPSPHAQHAAVGRWLRRCSHPRSS